MVALPVIAILTAGGFGCRADGDRLIVHPAEGLTDALRAMIRAAKPDLLAYLTPRRLWLLRHADGRLVSHSFTPPARQPCRSPRLVSRGPGYRGRGRRRARGGKRLAATR